MPSSWLYVGYLILRLCKGLFIIWTPGLLPVIHLITEREGGEREGEEEKEMKKREGGREGGRRREREEEHMYINRPCQAFGVLNILPSAAGSQLLTLI